MEEEESKWRMVLSKKNEALYYQNKITGLQRWTTHNCFCPKSKCHFNSPILPCCVKEIPKNPSAAFDKDSNVNEPGITPDISVELFSKKLYSLSDIIKEISSTPSPLQKRKNYSDIIEETRQYKSTHSPTKKIKTLWAHKPNSTLVNAEGPMTTINPFDSQSKKAVSLATESIETPVESLPVADNFLARIGLQRASTQAVSIATQDETTTGMSMRTQSSPAGTDITPSSESVDVSMATHNDSESVAMASHNDSESVSMATQNVVSNGTMVSITGQLSDTTGSAGFTDNTAQKRLAGCLTTDSIKTAAIAETKHVAMATLSEDVNSKEKGDIDVVRKISLNGYSLRNSGDDIADSSKYHKSPKKKKKGSKDKPKRPVGRPRKKRFWHGMFQKSKASAESKNDSSIELQTSNSECSSEHVCDKRLLTDTCTCKSESLLNGVQENNPVEDIQTGQACSASDSNDEVDVVGGISDSPNTENDAPELSRTVVNGNASRKTMTKRKRAAIRNLRAIARHKKKRRLPLNKSVSKTPQATSFIDNIDNVQDTMRTNTEQKTQSMLEQSIQELLQLEPLPISSTTSSVATSTENESCAATVHKPRSKHKTSGPNNNLATAGVNLPSNTSPPSTSSDVSPYHVDQLIDNLPQPKIQFVSDNNLESGAVFFPTKTTAPRNIESVVKSLRSSQSMVPVKGDFSMQTTTWLVDVLSELDTRKRTQLQKMQPVSNTTTDLELDKTENTSSTIMETASKLSHVSGENCDGSLNNSKTTEAVKDIVPQEECTHSSVLGAQHAVEFSPGHPLVVRAPSLSCKPGVEIVKPKEQCVEGGQPKLKEKAPTFDKSQVKSVQNKNSTPFGFKKVVPWYGHGGANNLTEVDATYIDLSWRIVTSVNGQNSTSLTQLHKLIPVHIQCETEDEPCSFLGIAGCSDKQVIAKILNTGIPEICQEVFVFKHAPVIADNPDNKPRKGTLSFRWNHGKVIVMPKSDSHPSSAKAAKNRNIIKRDNFTTVQLPKPLKLPESGSKVYLGEFQFVDNCLQFFANLVVIVALSPRPSLSMPPGALEKSSLSKVHTFKLSSNPGIDVKEYKNPNKVTKSCQTDNNFYRPCHICDVHVINFGDSKTHRYKHAKSVSLTCSECPRRFFNAGRLSVHIVSHKPNIINRCIKCGSKFRQIRYIHKGEHLRQICGCCQGDLICKKCSKQFTSPEELCLHVIENHGKPCRICSKKFIYKTDLIEHMKVGHQIDVII